MAGSRIRRVLISGSEKDGRYILLQTLPNGSKPLDLKILATENEAEYQAKLRHKRVGEVKTAHCSDDEWQEILIAALVEQHDQADIEIRADVKPGKSITLNFRKNIQGIKQPLGAIKLEQNDVAGDEEIDLFAWCIAVIGDRAATAQELAAAAGKTETQEHDAETLKAQLDELIKARDRDETELLEKFRDLLNAKKSKIRRQQRLLASAKFDAEAGASQHLPHKGKKGSRQAKRKAESSDETDDGFEPMDVDGGVTAEPSRDSEPEDEGQTTEEDEDPDEDETQDESSDDSNHKPSKAAPPAKKKGKGKGVTSKSKARGKSATATAKGKGVKSEPSSQKPAKNAVPPPPRILPFNKEKAAAAPPPAEPADAPAGQDDEETESDDEL